MGKVLNLRLDEETHRRVVRIAKASRRTKSDVVRAAIAEYARVRDSDRIAYDAWKDVLGVAEGLPPELSQRTGERFSEMLTGERRRRRRTR